MKSAATARPEPVRLLEMERERGEREPVPERREEDRADEQLQGCPRCMPGRALESQSWMRAMSSSRLRTFTSIPPRRTS